MIMNGESENVKNKNAIENVKTLLKKLKQSK